MPERNETPHNQHGGPIHRFSRQRAHHSDQRATSAASRGGPSTPTGRTSLSYSKEPGAAELPKKWVGRSIFISQAPLQNWSPSPACLPAISHMPFKLCMRALSLYGGEYQCFTKQSDRRHKPSSKSYIRSLLSIYSSADSKIYSIV